MIIYYPTVEMRWFGAGEPPKSMVDWYERIAPQAVKEDPRTDRYLKLAAVGDMGIKVREGRLEVKRMIGPGMLKELLPEVSGYVEGWRKWIIDLGYRHQDPPPSSAINWLVVTKARTLQSYVPLNDGWQSACAASTASKLGCEIELTTVTVQGQPWWTFAFEAFGPESQNRLTLLSVLDLVFNTADPPALSASDSYSYPAWIGRTI